MRREVRVDWEDCGLWEIAPDDTPAQLICGCSVREGLECCGIRTVNDFTSRSSATPKDWAELFRGAFFREYPPNYLGEFQPGMEVMAVFAGRPRKDRPPYSWKARNGFRMAGGTLVKLFKNPNSKNWVEVWTLSTRKQELCG